MKPFFIISICSTLLFACGQAEYPKNSQAEFAYDNAYDISVVNTHNGQPIVINQYSDIEISDVHNTIFNFDTNGHPLQITVGQNGNVTGNTVYLNGHARTLIAEVAGSNNKLIFADSGVLSNFVQISGTNNSLIMQRDNNNQLKPIVEYNPYYSDHNVFNVVGNGHYLEFADNAVINQNIKIHLI